jgi:hypothetical protein
MSRMDCCQRLRKNLAIDRERAGIFGHSMGGHGALSIALNNSGYYKTVFASAMRMGTKGTHGLSRFGVGTLVEVRHHGPY